MSDVKRIKTPWAYHYDDNGFFYIDGDEFVSPYIVATGGESDSDEANAKFIVEACNSYADAQATVETLQAQVKTARHDAVRAFVRGEDKMCLVCGAKEPCELKDDPSSPCTFDPTPMELKQQVEALQRELESANALLHKKNCAIGKAETTIEALQRERDEYARMWRDGCNDRGEAHKEIEELTAALDAEREKVKGLQERHQNGAIGGSCAHDASGRGAGMKLSKYWENQGKTLSDRRSDGRTFERSNNTAGCGECCNGDRCDDMSHFDRQSCPFCLGTGEPAKVRIMTPAGGGSNG